MKIIDFDERVHVLDNNVDVMTVINGIVDGGNQEDAFYICDVGDIVRKHKIFKAAMPRVEPFYAVKCNDSQMVLETLAALGTGFDCASKVEINKVLSLGVNPNRIIFANPAKPASHIRHANSTGVDLMTFDNESELYKIKSMFPTARMVIRIRCDAINAQCQLGMKFGCNPITEAPMLLDLAKDLGLDVVGVSFHVGSGCREPAVFRRAIATARKIFDYAEGLGYAFNLLDLGGGYPGGKGTSIDAIAHIVNEALEDYFPDPSVNIIAEPGRFYVASAYTLACNIHSIRTVNEIDPDTGDSTKRIMYYINDGVYGSFNCILYDHQHVEPIPLKVNSNAKYFHSSIWGPTCDGLDQVVDDYVLPEMSLGDWVVFEDMGAYTLPVASPFNGFPIPKVHVVADKNIWLLLKDMFPLSDKHFIIGSPIERSRLDRYDRTEKWADAWEMPSLPITIPIHNGNRIEEHILELVDVEN